MRRIACSLALLLAVAAVATAADPIVTLTVNERAGVARVGEPVTGGFPLPKGLVLDIGELTLSDASGKPLAAQFDLLDRWPDDNSVRWALLNTAVSVPAKGSAKLNVTRGKGGAIGTMKVTQEVGHIVVDTGKLCFAVKQIGGFDGIHEATLGGKAVIGAAGRGLYMDMDGEVFTSAADKEAKVTVESQGPQEVVLKAEGQLVGARGKKGFNYVVRIHAYAGSERLRVVPTVMMLYGKRNDTAKVKDLGFEIAVAGGASQFAIGGEKSIAAGGLSAGKDATIFYDSSDHYALGGAATGSGKGKSTKPLTVGWADLSGGGVGVAAGCRYFWQTFPKAISVGDGKLVLHLVWAPAAPLEIFSGMARTHELLVVPHAGATAVELQPVFVGHQLPLFPAASPKWYADSGTFGTIAPVGAPGPYAAKVAAWDEVMDRQFGKFLSERDLWQKRGVTMDAYGFLAFGDTLHWVWQIEPKGSPWDIAWDSNYYDKPLMVLLMWARSGKAEELDFFDASSSHLMDIDVIHFHQGFPLNAGSRRCPATNHVGFDPPDHKEAVGNFSFDHHKSESLFYRYYLTGDRYALWVATGLADWAFQAKDSPTGRNYAHQTESLVAMYWHTGKQKWLDRAGKLLDACVAANTGKWPTGNAFYSGLMTEAMAKYYYASHSRKALDTLLEFDDAMIANGGKFPNRAYGYAVAWKETGQKKYLDAAVGELLSIMPGHTGKDTPMHFRSTAYATGILAGAK